MLKRKKGGKKETSLSKGISKKSGDRSDRMDGGGRRETIGPRNGGAKKGRGVVRGQSPLKKKPNTDEGGGGRGLGQKSRLTLKRNTGGGLGIRIEQRRGVET